MTKTTGTQSRTEIDAVFEKIATAVVVAIVKTVAVSVWWALLFPMISVPIGAAVAVGVWLDWRFGVAVVGVFIAGMVLWRQGSPETFERWITSRARTRFLIWWRYRRLWDRRIEACGLTLVRDDAVFVPRLLGVEIAEAVDRLRVKMLPGHCPEDYENRVSRIAHTFGALDCRAVVVAPGVMELVMRQSDSLAHPIAVPRIDTPRWRKGAA
ncbi:hypothetical protein [Nocardia sp. NPDC052566]|uniref:hypothetical protein n=1 Tax=Nocardia sp. NPDC052566 TaxID=3364330 RepID=UPI0037C56D1E